MGFTLAGSLLGPAIGPVIGGVLAEFLGWRAIFWFLMIMGSAYMIIFAIFFPETGNPRFCWYYKSILRPAQPAIKSAMGPSLPKAGICP